MTRLLVKVVDFWTWVRTGGVSDTLTVSTPRSETRVPDPHDAGGERVGSQFRIEGKIRPSQNFFIVCSFLLLKNH